MSDSRPPPAFSGLLLHHGDGYSLFVPDGWQRLVDSDNGTFYAPDASDPLTGLAVGAQRLELRVKRSDLSTLRSGFLRGLRQLADCRMLSHEAEAVGPLITLEARH